MWFKRERDALKRHLENSARRFIGQKNIYRLLLLYFLAPVCLSATIFTLTSIGYLSLLLDGWRNEREKENQEAIISGLNDRFIRETILSTPIGERIGLNEIIQSAVFIKKCVIEIKKSEIMASRNFVEGIIRAIIRENYRTTYTFGSLSYVEVLYEVQPSLIFRKGRPLGASEGAMFVYMSAERENSVRNEITDSSRNEHMDSLGWIMTFHVQTNIRSIEDFIMYWMMRERDCGNRLEVEFNGIDPIL